MLSPVANAPEPMAAYSDGGIMASKPYVASGRYIDRMSNYCNGCRYKPSVRVGDDACPFATLYRDFLLRHDNALKGNRRMDMQLRSLKEIAAAARRQIRQQADALRHSLGIA